MTAGVDCDFLVVASHNLFDVVESTGCIDCKVNTRHHNAEGVFTCLRQIAWFDCAVVDDQTVGINVAEVERSSGWGDVVVDLQDVAVHRQTVAIYFDGTLFASTSGGEVITDDLPGRDSTASSSRTSEELGRTGGVVENAVDVDDVVDLVDDNLQQAASDWDDLVNAAACFDGDPSAAVPDVELVGSGFECDLTDADTSRWERCVDNTAAVICKLDCGDAAVC